MSIQELEWLSHTTKDILFGCCNHLGSNCLAFERHTKETRKALEEAIKLRKEKIK